MCCPTATTPSTTPEDFNDFLAITNANLGVAWGADGPGDTVFTNQVSPVVVRDGGGLIIPGPLTSGGVALDYTITTNPDGGQTLVARAGPGGDIIFTLTLDPDAGDNGQFDFVLSGPLDHPDGDGQNTLQLNFAFTAEDGDGDPVESSITIRVTDDIPYATDETSSAKVHENDLDNFGDPGIFFGAFDIVEGSDGTSPDGDTTPPIGGILGALIIDPIFAGSTADQGTLDGTVAFGADGPGGFFMTGETSSLEAQGLESKGETIEYATITVGGLSFVFGYVSNIGDDLIDEIFAALQDILGGNIPGNIGDIADALGDLTDPEFRLVFGLGVEEDGDYEFRLFDQLDHEAGARDRRPDHDRLLRHVRCGGLRRRPGDAGCRRLHRHREGRRAAAGRRPARGRGRGQRGRARSGRRD